MKAPSAPRREFTWVEGFAFFLGYVGVQLCSEVINQWGIYFYSPSESVGRIVYVAVGWVGWIFIIGTLWDAVTDPLIGIWSDKTRTRPGWGRLLRIAGRRRPFIFWGSIAMVASSVAFWYPPIAETSAANFWYGTALICIHWLFFTITTVPLIALGPEVARSEQERVRLGIWIGMGLLVGLAIANALTGEILNLLNTAPEGEPTSPEAYRRLSVIYALLSLALFQAPVWLVRERYDSDARTSPHEPFVAGMLDAFRNLPFVIYFAAFFLFTTGFLAVQRALPYWAELGLEGDEATVTRLLGPFLLTALLSYALIPAIARRLHVKWMIFGAFLILTTGLPWMYPIAVMDAGADTKTLLGGLLFAYCGIGQGVLYVMMMPMLGEIIDYDERRSGQRREALYNGLSGVAWKASMAGSIFIATQSMHWWGNSADHPLGVYLVGPIGGLFGLLGLIAMWFYPKLQRPAGNGQPPAHG